MSWEVSPMATISRRSFALGAAALGTRVDRSVAKSKVGAADKIRLGFVGIANRGSQLLDAALANHDIQVVALCDVHKTALDKWSTKLPGAQTYGDFRKMLERKDLDAVFIATPDHWHALIAIAACDAGKDVYCEKPLTITIHEGGRIVEAAKRTNRIFQVGLQRRSSPMFARLRELVQSGTPGK